MPHFGLLDDILKVAYGNQTCFAEFQMTFWLVLPSWFRKLSIVCTQATFLRILLALAEKIWNETNLQEVAQDWIFPDISNQTWRH